MILALFGERLPRFSLAKKGDELALDFHPVAVIEAAKQLGIKLTNAELGTELWAAWADGGIHAKLCFDDDRLEECKVAIEDANGHWLAFFIIRKGGWRTPPKSPSSMTCP